VSALTATLTVLTQKADGKGDKAEAWATGAKYDANNIYLAAVLRNRNMTRKLTVLSLTKLRTSKPLLSISSTSVCVRPSATFRLKVKTCSRRGFSGGDADLVKYVEVGATTTSTKTSTSMLTTNSTCWTTTITPSVGIVTDDQAAWVSFTSSNQYTTLLYA
jgi:outer membrane pore protein F